MTARVDVEAYRRRALELVNSGRVQVENLPGSLVTPVAGGAYVEVAVWIPEAELGRLSLPTARSASPVLDARDRECMLRNTYSVCQRIRRLRGIPLWSFVSQVTAYGSTSGALICKELGWDPDMPVGKDLPARKART